MSQPLVSFVMLTYNQEQFVFDAIEGVLSQDYPNIELIISDDASTDGTCDLIRTYLSENETKFPVTFIVNKHNKGIVGNFLGAIKECRGDFIAAAAGDDISLPNRVSAQLRSISKSNASIVVSDYKIMDDGGVISANVYSPYNKNDLVQKVFHEKNGVGIHGASAFYARRIFDLVPDLPGKYLFEDSLMTFVSYWNGLVVDRISEPLVLYRTHASSLSNSFHHRDGFRSMLHAEQKASDYSLNKYELFRDLSVALDVLAGQSGREFDVEAFKVFLLELHLKGTWYRCGAFSKARLLFACISGKCDIRWIVPRFFGVGVFSYFRFVRYLYKR